MRKRLPWLCIVFVPFVSGCAMNWEDYDSPQGRFSCKMPGKVEKKETKVTLPGVGALTLHTHVTEGRNWAYGVNWFDIPRGKPFDLDMGIKGAAYMLRGDVKKRRPCTANGLKGVEFEIAITSPKNGYASGRLFVVKGRVYQIAAIGTGTELESNDVQEFFNSFKLKQ